MVKKLKDYKNVRLNGPDGTQSPVFSTGAEAEQWYKTNYPTGYKVVEQQSEPTYQGKTLPEVTVTANAPVDYDQLQDARRQIINGNYYGKKFVPTPQNVAYYLNLMNKDRQVANATDPSEWAKFAVGNVLPVAAAAPLAGMTIPAAIGTTVGGLVGGMAGDKAGQALHHTFVDPNTSIGEYTAKLWNNSRPFGVKLPNISSSTGELANLGTLIGGSYGWNMPFRTRESFYQHITPMGYHHDPEHGVDRFEDSKRFIAGILKPFTRDGYVQRTYRKLMGKENPSDPEWWGRYSDWAKNNPDKANLLDNAGLTLKALAAFRKDATDLVFHPEKYKGKLYVRKGTAENGDPIYDYNYDEVDRIRQQNRSYPLEYSSYVFGNNSIYGIDARTPTLEVGKEVTALGHDIPSWNGGFAPLTFTPTEITPHPGGYYNLGRPAIHIRDRWDTHPFQNPNRTNFIPFKIASKIPGIKNLEIMNLLGGKPFVLDTTIPKGKVRLWQRIAQTNGPQNMTGATY